MMNLIAQKNHNHSYNYQSNTNTYNNNMTNYNSNYSINTNHTNTLSSQFYDHISTIIKSFRKQLTLFIKINHSFIQSSQLLSDIIKLKQSSLTIIVIYQSIIIDQSIYTIIQRFIVRIKQIVQLTNNIAPGFLNFVSNGIKKIELLLHNNINNITIYQILYHILNILPSYFQSKTFSPQKIKSKTKQNKQNIPLQQQKTTTLDLILQQYRKSLSILSILQIDESEYRGLFFSAREDRNRGNNELQVDMKYRNRFIRQQMVRYDNGYVLYGQKVKRQRQNMNKKQLIRLKRMMSLNNDRTLINNKQQQIKIIKQQNEQNEQNMNISLNKNKNNISFNNNNNKNNNNNNKNNNKQNNNKLINLIKQQSISNHNISYSPDLFIIKSSSKTQNSNLLNTTTYNFNNNYKTQKQSKPNPLNYHYNNYKYHSNKQQIYQSNNQQKYQSNNITTQSNNYIKSHNNNQSNNYNQSSNNSQSSNNKFNNSNIRQQEFQDFINQIKVKGQFRMTKVLFGKDGKLSLSPHIDLNIKQHNSNSTATAIKNKIIFRKAQQNIKKKFNRLTTQPPATNMNNNRSLKKPQSSPCQGQRKIYISSQAPQTLNDSINKKVRKLTWKDKQIKFMGIKGIKNGGIIDNI